MIPLCYHLPWTVSSQELVPNKGGVVQAVVWLVHSSLHVTILVYLLNSMSHYQSLRPEPIVLQKLPIFLWCNSSLFCSLALPILLIIC